MNKISKWRLIVGRSWVTKRSRLSCLPAAWRFLSPSQHKLRLKLVPRPQSLLLAQQEYKQALLLCFPFSASFHNLNCAFRCRFILLHTHTLTDYFMIWTNKIQTGFTGLQLFLQKVTKWNSCPSYKNLMNVCVCQWFEWWWRRKGGWTGKASFLFTTDSSASSLYYCSLVLPLSLFCLCSCSSRCTNPCLFSVCWNATQLFNHSPETN